MQLPPVDGSFRTDGAARDAAAQDFGHVVHNRPKAVLEPASGKDIEKVTAWSRQHRGKVAARGQGHSVYGRSETDGGIVVDMTKLNRVHSITGDRAVVDPGIKWSELLDATLPKKLVPPVLTDYVELSVGGTIAVGGVGGTTYTDGVQSDNVLELEVVTGTGRTVVCSARQNHDLFNTVRAGLGQVATITKVTLKLVPAPESARRYMLTYPDLATLLKDQRLLVRDKRFEYLQGAVLPNPSGGWQYTLDVAKLFTGNAPDDAKMLAGLSDDRSAAKPSTLPYIQYIKRLAPLEAALRQSGEWTNPHPWITTFVGDSAIEKIASSTIAALTPADLGKYGRVVISPLTRRAITSPLLRTPNEDVLYAFNLLRFPPNDPAVAQQQVTANRALYEKVLAVGGVLYPVSAFPMSRDDWRRHFGWKYRPFADAKRHYDPQDVLTPGYEVF